MRTLLLDIAPVAQEQIFRIKGEEKPEKEAVRYSELVKKNVTLQNNCPAFDIVLLGATHDGNTSSILSGQEQTFSSKQIYEVSHNPHGGQARIFLTGYPIIKAHQVIFLITGKEKASVVHNICTSGDTSPAAYIFHHANNAEIF
jgi:6-phosphogluconolactonase